MKDTDTYNSEILDITMTISDTFPELSKFIDEMPVKLYYTSAVVSNMSSLDDYYDSLEMLFQKYHITHKGSKPFQEQINKRRKAL